MTSEFKAEKALAEFGPDDLLRLFSHRGQRETFHHIEALIGTLRNCETPQQFFEFQQELFGHAMRRTAGAWHTNRETAAQGAAASGRRTRAATDRRRRRCDDMGIRGARAGAVVAPIPGGRRWPGVVPVRI